MKTRKHLSVFHNISTFALAICIVATIICFIAMISGETSMPFIVSLCGCLIFYGNTVFLSVVIDFYDAIVTPRIAKMLKELDEEEI